MTAYQTTTIDEQELKGIIDDCVQRVNSFSRKYSPFRIVMEVEQLDPEMDVQVCRFSLAVTSDFEVPERKSVQFINQLKDAAREVENMNSWNCVLAMPPRRGPSATGRH